MRYVITFVISILTLSAYGTFVWMPAQHLSPERRAELHDQFIRDAIKDLSCDSDSQCDEIYYSGGCQRLVYSTKSLSAEKLKEVMARSDTRDRYLARVNEEKYPGRGPRLCGLPPVYPRCIQNKCQPTYRR